MILFTSTTLCIIVYTEHLLTINARQCMHFWRRLMQKVILKYINEHALSTELAVIVTLLVSF